jgi:hypothetical protein
MYRIVFGLLFLSIGVLSAQDLPKRSDAEKLRANKALQAVKQFTGEDGRALPETVLIDVGLIDRFSREEEEHFPRVCEILLTHMLPDRQPTIASAAGLSLYSILKENTPTGGDYNALKEHQIYQREWTTKVLSNKSLRSSAAFQQYLVEKNGR